MSHVDKIVDRGYHREILATGAFVVYDQAFRWGDRPNWTLPRLADAIEKRSGVRISRSRLSVVLRQKGISAGDGLATR